MAKDDENKKNVTENQENVNKDQKNVNENQENEQENKPKEGWLKKAVKAAGKVVKNAWNFEVTLSPRKVVCGAAGIATAIFIGKKIYEAGQADAQAMLGYSEDEYEALPGEVGETTDVYDNDNTDNMVDVTDYEEEVVEE